MKTTIKTCGLVFVITFLVIACQKNENVNDPQKQEPFNAKNAKEWYYGTFKKSAEWGSSPDKGKKLPDWKSPMETRFGTNEIIEFPLVQEKKRHSISASIDGKALQKGEIVRMANAAVTKIVFIKKASGETLIREIEYIPDYEYLETKNFDIGTPDIFKSVNDFTGRVIVKSWGGDVISKTMFYKGKVTKRGSILATNKGLQEMGGNLNESTCHQLQMCVWQQDCTITLYSDGMMSQFCGPWYNTGECWIEEWCDDEGEDPCEIAGIGCGGDDDGGGEEVNCQDVELQLEGTSVSDDLISETSGVTAVTRTKKYHWTIFRQNWGLWRFISHESGVHVKTGNIQHPWKWQSLDHLTVSKDGVWNGGTIECTVNTVDTQIGLYWASIDLNYTISNSAICKGSPLAWTTTSNSAKIIGIDE